MIEINTFNILSGKHALILNYLCQIGFLVQSFFWIGFSPTKPPFVTFHEMEIHQDEHPNTDQITSRFKIYGDLPIQDWFTKLTARQKIENITVAFITQYQWSNYIKHTNILPTASFKILICIFFSYFVAKVTSLKCVSSKKLQQYDPIVALRGDLLVWNLGYELYKCYGSLYNGILIFNLGHDFGYMWYDYLRINMRKYKFLFWP